MAVKGKDKGIYRQTDELKHPQAGNSPFMDSSLGLYGAITFIMSFFPPSCQPLRKIATILNESHNNDDESC